MTPDPSRAAGIGEADLHSDPIEQFRHWLSDATAAGIPEPNAMVLATAMPDGRPSARFVLLRSFDAGGFVFYSHYGSRKGREIAANPRAALAFYWRELDRQVRIEGAVERVPAAESDAYFDERPLGSRLGAIASPQSEVIGGREELERRVQEVVAEHRHHPHVTRPEYWGGYRVIPDELEFWVSRPNRLHDRLRYRLEGGGWRIDRLAP